MKIVWKSIPTVLFHDELLDKAYSRATKAADRVDDPHRIFRVRKQMNRMLQTASDVIAETLLEWVADWPSLDKLPVFDEAMVEAAVGCDDYRHHLSMLQWGAKQVRNIAGQNQKKITRTANVEFMHESRREAYGRISSIVRQVGPSLAWLNDARETLRNLPSIDAMEPCIVVAGAPNVGKSALINALSSGNPEVASYPFTTKQLHVGHFDLRRLKYQLVDTPGLLDRPMHERNIIEMQAIAALRHIGSVVIFLFDPSETIGISAESQLHLLEEVRELMPQREFVLIRSKGDLSAQRDEGWEEIAAAEAAWVENGRPIDAEIELLTDLETGYITASSTENVGLESLRLHIAKIANALIRDEPMSLPEGWPRRDIH
ncbi:MAG: 50S ribosome-binding GTPase [Pseudomonadales bacterium]|nr:50S ribosome-binding GTPase [Pseudomonadales bacterium]